MKIDVNYLPGIAVFSTKEACWTLGHKVSRAYAFLEKLRAL
jgi:hypothetical protein